MGSPAEHNAQALKDLLAGFGAGALIPFAACGKDTISSKDLSRIFRVGEHGQPPWAALPPSAPLERVPRMPPQHLLSDSSSSLISGTGLSLAPPLLL